MVNHSEYIVYVDESGDHGLVSVDPTYPLFVLAFCLFRKTQYINEIVPAMLHFKFKYFGHDMTVLHEHEIRKSKGPFTILFDKDVRGKFQTDLSIIIDKADFGLIAAVIHKDRMKGIVDDSTNLYHVALGIGLEAVNRFLVTNGQEGNATHVICEARGKNEDRDLELEFRRVCDGENSSRSKLPLKIVFASKLCNSSGLQLADLVARPVGRKTLQPNQANRAFDILEKKFVGGAENGLMVYSPPAKKRKAPD